MIKLLRELTEGGFTVCLPQQPRNIDNGVINRLRGHPQVPRWENRTPCLSRLMLDSETQRQHRGLQRRVGDGTRP